MMLPLPHRAAARKSAVHDHRPVGLGENFAAFMHLADFDEKLVTPPRKSGRKRSTSSSA